jgi:hypothetical protein
MLIVYQNNDFLTLVAPIGSLPLEEVARKDVPAGVPYLLVNPEDLPDDWTFMAAWEADFTNPDGYGIGAEAWFAEQKIKKSI